MGFITGFTADRAQAIEANAIVAGEVVGDDLILTTFAGAEINAGDVRGAPGTNGADGGLPVLPALRRWHQSLAGRHSAAANAIFLGTSITEGQGASTFDKKFLQRAQTQIRQMYPSDGVGSGGAREPIIPASRNVYGDSASWVNDGMSGITGTHNDYNYGPYGRNNRDMNSAATITFTVPFATKVVLHWSNRAAFTGVVGSWQHLSAAGPVTNFSSSGVDNHTPSVQMYSGTRLTNPTFKITSSNNACAISGIEVFDGDESAGIRFQNWGHTGNIAEASWYNSGADLAAINAAYAAANPSLFVIELGNNELLTGDTPASFKTNLQAIITGVKTAMTIDPSFVLVGLYNPASAPTYPHADYLTAMKEIAASDPSNVCFLDMSLLMPPTSDTTGFYRSDTVHPTDLGHTYLADALVSFLVP